MISMLGKLLQPRKKYRCVFLIFVLTLSSLLTLCYHHYLSSRRHRRKEYVNSQYEYESQLLEQVVPKYINLFHPSRQNREKYELEIRMKFAKVIPGAGEYGEKIALNKKDQKLAAIVRKKESFNVFASDRITPNRTTPDNRNKECHFITYDQVLPSASVVIVFYNEPWSTLLRTIHTIINYSPPDLLHEIILVDDYSTRKELKGRLGHYVDAHLPTKVKLYRANQRLGLIRAKSDGARASTGQVVIFLDSHCEVTFGWMEPLLQRIKENGRTVCLPVVDIIDEQNMEFLPSDGWYFQVGGFKWSGFFKWIDVPSNKIERGTAPINPIQSPTMSGGILAISRRYFWEIGGYDEQMDIWGAENLEMSFRVWMCGGSLETIPCSRVGHIFRPFHPKHNKDYRDSHGRNTVRMAEVWMDDYKRLFYLSRNDLRNISCGDISDRLNVRKQLNCKSFKWYLENIYPEKFILDRNVLAYGKLSNKKFRHLCFDTMQRNENHDFNMGLYHCYPTSEISQFMSLSKTNQLRREERCAEVHEDFSTVLMAKCDSNKMSQKWIHTKDGSIFNILTGKCLDVLNMTSEFAVGVVECTGDVAQRWVFDVYVGS